MHRRTSPRWAIAALFLLPAVAGCDDAPPTLSDPRFFPDDARPVTVDTLIPAPDFLSTLGVFGDYPLPRAPNYLVVAEDYGGSLDAHALARFAGFPEQVTFQNAAGEDTTVTEFAFGTGAVVVPVDVRSSAAPGPATLRLWALAQPWDSATVTWTLASDTAGGSPTPWTEPGGTRADLLSTTVWTPGDAEVVDTLRFALDSLTVARLADEDFPGVLVTVDAGARVQLRGISLETGVRPTARPDTLIAVSPRSIRRFVFDPPPPLPAGSEWAAGGIGSTRTLLGIDFDQRVPLCAAGACGTAPLDSVELNQVALVLRPVDVPGGFEALDSVPITLREVREPELGRNAPLGTVVVSPPSGSTLPVAWWHPGDDEVVVTLTAFAASVAGGDGPQERSFALVSQLPGLSSEATTFGQVWFEGEPRLRVVYTLTSRNDP